MSQFHSSLNHGESDSSRRDPSHELLDMDIVDDSDETEGLDESSRRGSERLHMSHLEEEEEEDDLFTLSSTSSLNQPHGQITIPNPYTHNISSHTVSSSG